MPTREAREFLADASRILLSSLEYEVTLARVADLIVPKYADWCTVTVIDPETGERNSLFAKHHDPNKVILVEEWRKRLSQNEDPENGETAVLRTGVSQLIPKITREAILEAPLDEEIKQVILDLQLSSYVCVALKARDKVLGAISLIWAESGKTYTKKEVNFFEELALSAALAIDNAQLYTTAQRELAHKTAAEAALRSRAIQQEVIAELGKLALSGATVQEVMNETSKQVAQVLNLDFVHIMQRLPAHEELVLRAAYGLTHTEVGVTRISTSPEYPAGLAITQKQEVVIHDLKNDPRFQEDSLLGKHEVASGVTFLIGDKEAPWGILGAHSRKQRSFSKDAFSFLQSVTNLLALALEWDQAEEETRYHAFHDTLTGLPNRILLEDRLNLEIARAKRNDTFVGVILLDIDFFQHINDGLGHLAGDHILKEAGNRLEECTRLGDTVARFGGDEFALVIPDLPSPEDLAELAEHLLKCFEDTFNSNEREVRVNASMGVAIYPTDGTDTESLIMNADTALYRAKEQGRNRYQFYTQAMNLRSSERLSLELDLNKAIEGKEFELWYMPIVSITENKIIGVEALIRWRHPELGIIYPNSFFELADDIGLSSPLLKFSLETAARQIKEWDEHKLPPLTVSLNFSARQLQQPDMLDICKTAVKETGVNPSRIDIEITETMAMQDITAAAEKLKQLREIGFGTAIDDFGIGHSSLSYLKRLPVTKLKIDQSFVRDCINNPQDTAIIRAIISLAQTLDFQVIAEGVEDKDQLAFLLSLSCDAAQGYLFSPAVPAPDFEKLLLSY